MGKLIKNEWTLVIKENRELTLCDILSGSGFVISLEDQQSVAVSELPVWAAKELRDELTRRLAGM